MADIGTGFGLPGMSEVLARNWWAIALRGVIAILYGIIALLWPGVTALSLALLLAVYLVADGVLTIVAGIRAGQRHERWGWLLLEGVVDIGVGLLALFMPGAALLALVWLVAVWAIVTGIAELVAAWRLQTSHGNWLLAIAGILSILLGIGMAVMPIAGAVALAFWTGAYALAFGITLLVLAARLYRRRHGVGGRPMAG